MHCHAFHGEQPNRVRISCRAAVGRRAEVDLTAQNGPVLGLSLHFVWSQ